MANLICCGINFTRKANFQRHISSKHKTASPIFRCLVEGCSKRFSKTSTLNEHQKSHIFNSDIFYLQTQAFNNTTLVLRKELEETGVEDFDFITSEDGVNELRSIINSEVVKKNALTFSIALTINFIKYGIDGDISAKASPCFLSSPHYLNSVSTYNVKEILISCVHQVQKRYDDFVDKGSGWSLHSLKYYDLHITQINDLRGGCDPSIIHNLDKVLSRRAGLININNRDDKCLLYCIAATFTEKNTCLMLKNQTQIII